MEETVAQKALRLLNPIPANKFMVEAFSDEISKCCIIGHYKRLTSDNPDDYSFENCSDNFLSDLRLKGLQFGVNIAGINNSPNCSKYNQKTAKARSIACLKDMIKAGY